MCAQKDVHITEETLTRTLLAFLRFSFVACRAAARAALFMPCICHDSFLSSSATMQSFLQDVCSHNYSEMQFYRKPHVKAFQPRHATPDTEKHTRMHRLSLKLQAVMMHGIQEFHNQLQQHSRFNKNLNWPMCHWNLPMVRKTWEALTPPICRKLPPNTKDHNRSPSAPELHKMGTHLPFPPMSL